MGILLSAMAAAGDAGVQSQNQNIIQLQQMEAEKQKSILETQKAQALTDYTISAKNNSEDQQRTQQMDRIHAAAKGHLEQATIDNAQEDPDYDWVSSDTKMNPDGTAVRGTKPEAPLMSDFSPEDLAKYAPTQEQQADAYLAAARSTGDISPQVSAQLAMQDAAQKRSEESQERQFKHADASQIASQNFQAGQQQRQIAATAAGQAASISATNARMMPSAEVGQDEKDLWIRKYIADGGAVPRSAPAYVRNSIGSWAAQKGITPDDLSKGTAQAKFDSAAAGTSGHRAGAMASVEATMPALVANAQEVSHKLGQGNFVPINKLMQMADDTISNPTLAEFKVAHMAVVSEYQQVISRGGTNVTALNEAMHVLNGARGVEAYDAAMNMVKKEVAINVAGTAAVRANMGGAHGGAKPVPTMAGPGSPAPTGIPDGWSVRVH